MAKRQYLHINTMPRTANDILGAYPGDLRTRNARPARPAVRNANIAKTSRTVERTAPSLVTSLREVEVDEQRVYRHLVQVPPSDLNPHSDSREPRQSVTAQKRPDLPRSATRDHGVAAYMIFWSFVWAERSIRTSPGRSGHHRGAGWSCRHAWAALDHSRSCHYYL